MTKPKKVTKRRRGQSASKAMLGSTALPRAFIDEQGQIIVVGFEHWNNASYVDSDRAFPDSWILLVEA